MESRVPSGRLETTLKSRFCSAMVNITKETSRTTVETAKEYITTRTETIMMVNGIAIRELAEAEFSRMMEPNLMECSLRTRLTDRLSLKTKTETCSRQIQLKPRSWMTRKTEASVITKINPNNKSMYQPVPS